MSMAAHAARRLLRDGGESQPDPGDRAAGRMRRAATSMRRCGRATRLERVRALVRARVPHLDEDRFMAARYGGSGGAGAIRTRSCAAAGVADCRKLWTLRSTPMTRLDNTHVIRARGVPS